MADELLLSDLLTRIGSIDTKMDTLLERTSAHGPQIDAHEKALQDHTKRIRDLEQSKWRLAGGAAAVGGLTAILATVVELALRPPG